MLNFALKLALFLLLLSTIPARSQEAYIGRGLVCDTADEVRAFLSSKDDPTTTLTRINAEKKACALLQVVYLRGEDVDTVQGKDGKYRITAITVVGVHNGQTFIPTEPLAQYTLFTVPGQEV
jgi:hypothetical protein